MGDTGMVDTGWDTLTTAMLPATVAMPMLVTTTLTQPVLSMLPSVPPMPSQKMTLMPMPMLTTTVLVDTDLGMPDTDMDTDLGIPDTDLDTDLVDIEDMPDLDMLDLDMLVIILASVAPMPSQRPMLMLIMDIMVMDMVDTVDTMVMDMVMDTDIVVMDMAMVMVTTAMASKSRSNTTTRKQLP